MRLKRTVLLLNLLVFSTAFLLGQTLEVYVSDAGNFTSGFQILKFDENGENPEVFISSPLGWPQDIVFLEDQGVVLISNLSTGNIAKHHSETGAFIENFATGLGGPTRMKIGADSLLYVLQWAVNGKVLRYELDGTYVDEFTSTGVSRSIGLDWDSDGNLYVSSYSADKVQKFDPSGTDMGAFVSSNLVGPTNIFFDANGDLIVLDYDGGSIKKFAADGSFIEILISGLSGPEGVAFLPNGNMLVGNGGNGSVREYDMDGNYIKDFIAPGLGGLQTPNVVVIRETTSVGVADPEVVSNYVIPSVGSTFFLNTDISRDIKSIEIYNSSGTLIEKKSPDGNEIWNANRFPEGMYLVAMRSFDNEVSTQKIVVKK